MALDHAVRVGPLDAAVAGEAGAGRQDQEVHRLPQLGVGRLAVGDVDAVGDGEAALVVDHEVAGRLALGHDPLDLHPLGAVVEVQHALEVEVVPAAGRPVHHLDRHPGDTVEHAVAVHGGLSGPVDLAHRASPCAEPLIA